MKSVLLVLLNILKLNTTQFIYIIIFIFFNLYQSKVLKLIYLFKIYLTLEYKGNCLSVKKVTNFIQISFFVVNKFASFKCSA